jgi:protein-tyrosine phosphatase
MHLKYKTPPNSFVAIVMAAVMLFTPYNGRALSPDTEVLDTEDDLPKERAGIMAGAPNFRDLGGYPVADGRQTVWRKVFRSQTLTQLNDSDVDKMSELGIRTVIDFRSDDEVHKDPSRLPEGVNVIRLPIDLGRNDSTQIPSLTSGTLDSLQGIAFMEIANRKFVTEFIPQFKAFFEILLRPESYPLVFHCTAGKDRTGFAAALLLSALNVEWNTVMDDYLLTNRYLNPPSFTPQIPEQSQSGLRQLWSVRPSYLNAAQDEIVARYGTIDHYLQQELNVGETERNDLRRLLLR